MSNKNTTVYRAHMNDRYELKSHKQTCTQTHRHTIHTTVSQNIHI